MTADPLRSAPKGKPPTDFYPCGRCGGFHLTTKTNDGRGERMAPDVDPLSVPVGR